MYRQQQWRIYFIVDAVIFVEFTGMETMINF